MNPTQTRDPQRSRRSAGFTLIEIMVVITLIGLIATVVVPGIMNNVDKGKITTTKAKMSNLGGVLDGYRLLHSKYPDSLTELMEPDDKNLGEPYIDDPEALKDSWGNEFIYSKSSSRKYELISLGGDGFEGGDGPDADISSDKNKMVGN